jgi:glycosyltransferase involved in cell wall biosynthesis
VLITIHRLSQGGADRVTMLLANGFAAAGFATAIAVFRGDGEAEEVLRDMLRRDVAVLSAGPPMGSRHLELVRGLRFVQRQVAEARPAVVLASSSNMGLTTGLSARLQRGRRPAYVMKLTNPVIRPRDRGLLARIYRRRLYDFIFGSFDRVLILSDAERKTLCAMFPQHEHRFKTVLSPFVAPDMLADAPPVSRPSAPQILTLARMMPQKRLDRLLEAFARTEDKASRLTILGDGPGRRDLEQLAERLGIAARVEMPGFVEDVTPWLRRSDLFALSSDYEGLPAAVFEALACNVPVVTTDCFEEARSLLSGAERCAVVPREDTQALARAIDASLAARSKAIELRELARDYGFDAAIAAHVAELRSLIPADSRI